MLSLISGLGHGHLDVHSNRKVIKTPMFREFSGRTDSSEQPCRKGLTKQVTATNLMYLLTEYCQLTLGKVVLSKGLDGQKKKVVFF